MKPGMAPTERYQNTRSWLYTVGDDPDKAQLILGPGVNPRVEVPRTDFAYVLATPGSKWAVAVVYAGVQREVTLYSAPLDTVGKPDTPWTPIAKPADKVTDYATRGNDIYLMTHAASPRFSVVKTRSRQAGSQVGSRGGSALHEVVSHRRRARALYGRRAMPVSGERMDAAASVLAAVKLPIEGSADDVGLPDADGAIVALAAWTRRGDLRGRRIGAKNTGLQPLGPSTAQG